MLLGHAGDCVGGWGFLLFFEAWEQRRPRRGGGPAGSRTSVDKSFGGSRIEQYGIVAGGVLFGSCYDLVFVFYSLLGIDLARLRRHNENSRIQLGYRDGIR